MTIPITQENPNSREATKQDLLDIAYLLGVLDPVKDRKLEKRMSVPMIRAIVKTAAQQAGEAWRASRPCLPPSDG
jgi:hypothetical protein